MSYKRSKYFLTSSKRKIKYLFLNKKSQLTEVFFHGFKSFQRQLAGFIGIASAPEFTKEIMWKKFSNKIKRIILNNKIYYLENDYETPYPITKNLIMDGRKNKVLNKRIDIIIPLVLFHGLKDKLVPLKFSKKIYKLFKTQNKKIIKIKDGDHSLSRKKDLRRICSELRKMTANIT